MHDWGRFDYDDNKNTFITNQYSTNISNIRFDKESIIFQLQVLPNKQSIKNDYLTEFISRKKREIACVFSRLKFIDGYNIIIELDENSQEPITFSMNDFNK